MIISLIKSVFRNKANDPQIGDIYAFQDREDSDSPWEKDNISTVIITDTKKGWVRYDMKVFSNNSMKTYEFLTMYKLVERGV